MPKKWSEDTRGVKAKAQKAEAVSAKAAKSSAALKRRDDEEWAAGTNKRALEKSESATEKSAARAAALKAKREQEAKEAADMGIGGKGASRGTAKVAARKGAAMALEGRVRAKAAIPTLGASGMDDILMLMADVGLESKARRKKGAGVEKHPEKRMKAAFAAFEDRELPLMRKEFPGLKRSQLKERLWKQWQKSDENPMNQEHTAFNTGGAKAASRKAASAVSAAECAAASDTSAISASHDEA